MNATSVEYPACSRNLWVVGYSRVPPPPLPTREFFWHCTFLMNMCRQGGKREWLPPPLFRVGGGGGVGQGVPNGRIARYVTPARLRSTQAQDMKTASPLRGVISSIPAWGFAIHLQCVAKWRAVKRIVRLRG